MKNLIVLILIFYPFTLFGQEQTRTNTFSDLPLTPEEKTLIDETLSTNQPSQQQIGANESAIELSEIITFSEHPNGTRITNQYTDIGIVFGGSEPFITGDGANPTSPVLSGSPLFEGDITGTFVIPGTEIPTVVESFTLDAGYFNELNSTRIEWFNPDGEKLGQVTNSIFGIERFTITGGNIASWKIGIIATETAGYAIDNVSFTPVGPSIVFREKGDDSWFFGDDEIPGFDHVGFHIDDKVYESHPGYEEGTYYTEAGDTIFVNDVNGVQSEFSREAFIFDSMVEGVTPVEDVQEIPVNRESATAMLSAINTLSNTSFQFIDYGSIEGIQQTLLPDAQKGGDNSFTCVGMVEWAAEQAGINDGQGFIRDDFESFSVPGIGELPALSPQLMYYAMQNQQTINNINQWLQGLFDPVDFLLVDPLGRRLGFTAELGEVNEIPNALFTGDGAVELFFIPSPVPGPYTVILKGLESEAMAGITDAESAIGFQGFLSEGEEVERELYVQPKPGTGGDVDGNGNVDDDDVLALTNKLGTFPATLVDAGDLDGDGVYTDSDVSLLIALLNVLDDDDDSGDLLKPEGLRGAVYSDTAGEIFWTRAAASQSVVEYEIYRNGDLVATRDGTSYFDNTLMPNMEYRYHIVAIDVDGNRSEPSNEAVIVTTSDLTDLKKPSGLVGTVYSSTSGEIFWKRATPEESIVKYDIYRDGELVDTRDALSYYDDSLTDGNRYTYYVVAIDINGRRSEPSDLIVLDTTRNVNRPEMPTGLTGAVYSSTAIEIFWDRAPVSESVTHYEIFQNGELVATRDGTSFFTEGLDSDTRYTFTVVAIDSNGQRSKPSNSVTLVTIR